MLLAQASIDYLLDILIEQSLLSEYQDQQCKQSNENMSFSDSMMHYDISTEKNEQKDESITMKFTTDALSKDSEKQTLMQTTDNKDEDDVKSEDFDDLDMEDAED